MPPQFIDDDEDEHRLRETPDDALEEERPDDIFNPDIDEERLAEDYGSPATPAPRPRAGTPLPPDHPEFDYDLDPHEMYDAGILGATDADTQEESEPEDATLPLEPDDEE